VTRRTETAAGKPMLLLLLLAAGCWLLAAVF